MFEKMARVLPTERFMRRPPVLPKHIGAGALLGAGLGYAGGEMRDQADWKDLALGALAGAYGGNAFAHGSADAHQKIHGLEIALKDAEIPVLFGKKRQAAEIADLKNEIYNLGLKEYWRSGLEAAAPSLVPLLAFEGGRTLPDPPHESK